MYVCMCFAVRDADVADAVQCGAHSADEVATSTGASTGCGSCRETLCARVAAHRATQSPLDATSSLQ